MKKSKIFVLLLSIILLINSKTFAVSNSNNTKNIKWEEEIIYFILTDRFYDGDKTNNGVYGENSYDPNHLEAYHGGDFQGIIDKIPYLKQLGITTLWITPIVKNIETNMREKNADKQYSYHGYWAEDFTKLDPNLGDENKLKELIDALHENDIKLMIDVVLNHAGYGTEKLPQFNNMFRKKDGVGDIESRLAGLPDFKTEDLEVRKKLIQWQTDWIKNLKTKKGNTIDYFRVDTVKHVDHNTWKEFKDEILKINPNFKLMGEVFDANIHSTKDYLSKEMMDSLLDFDFKNIAKDFTRGKFEEIDKKLKKRNKLINADTTMNQFLSSHDENGFLKMKLSDDKNLFKSAVTLQLTAKGIPVIYYGEEIGMSGQKDNFNKGIYSENRASFDWDKVENNDILEHYKRIISIRKDFKEIFANGERELIYSDDEVYVFQRSYNDKKILVGINISEKPKKIEINNVFKNNKIVDIYSHKTLKADENKIKTIIPSTVDGGSVFLITSEMVPQGYNIQSMPNYFYYIMIFLGVVLVILSFVFRKKEN